MGSAVWRYEAETFGNVYNTNTNSNVFGGGSVINELDLRDACKITQQIEIATGANNAIDRRAFAFYPTPGRTGSWNCVLPDKPYRACSSAR